MTQLMLELSKLDVEPIELQEVELTGRQGEQNGSLETLTAPEGKNDVLAILTLTTPLPVNGCGGCSCCGCGYCCSNGACFCGE